MIKDKKFKKSNFKENMIDRNPSNIKIRKRSEKIN